ncbi:MAG: hypothetical protein ACTHJ3_02030 [Pararhizobium sp.]
MAAASNTTTSTDCPRDPLTPRGRTSLEIDMTTLRKLGMKELHDFRDVMHVIGDVLSGFTCQPRFGHEHHEYRLNGAGELLEGIAELMSGYEQAAVNVAVAAKPTGSDAVEWRGWMILGFEADMADDLAPFAVLATEAVRDEAEAKFREQHRR